MHVRTTSSIVRKRYAVGLATLSLAFLVRVLVQALVAFFRVDFLPPMQHWQSGLIPYALLLSAQVVILIVQTRISADVWRGAGWFAACRPRGGVILRWISFCYFLAMVARYVLTMYFYPDRRWLTGTIPIFFHWVLAAYLFVLGRYYSSSACVTPLKR